MSATPAKYDVTGIGNAIVDVLANTDQDFPDTHNIPRGGMRLIDQNDARSILEAMKQTTMVSGGSAANSIAALASLEGRGGFIGKVAGDALGDVFRNSLQEMGVHFPTNPLRDGTETGRCLVAVTPDAERSMATFIGAAEHVSISDVDSDLIADSAVTYFEGYLFEQEKPRAAFVKACEIAKQAGRKTAITLSDRDLAVRQRADLLAFISAHTDIVFANEGEAMALMDKDNFDDALREIGALAPYVIVTRSGDGSLIVDPEMSVHEVAAIAPEILADTTGAGDAYAGGFLFGLSRDMSPEQCAIIGGICAAEVISHIGPRPEQSLKQLVKAAGLIEA